MPWLRLGLFFVTFHMVDMYKIKRFDFTPILGWSVSRYDMFQSCKRQYFYAYYGKYDIIIPVWKINALKQMTSVPLETGNIANDIIEVLLTRLQKTDDPIDTYRFVDYVRRKTEEYCKAKIFSEIYYSEIKSVSVDGIFETVKMCLDN
ncbi:MAG: PD-(D/E)XK nuclease family protein, partial [Deltaproteobacteria bacterium]|nr:PD-(D/E)XK nuclease family protein [Deltaproteobacteria bacterium]